VLEPPRAVALLAGDLLAGDLLVEDQRVEARQAGDHRLEPLLNGDNAVESAIPGQLPAPVVPLALLITPIILNACKGLPLLAMHLETTFL